MKKILIFSTIIVLCFMAACISLPDVDDYAGRPQACLDFDRCMYYNQKNKDKSICIDYAKECRAYGRFEYCKDQANLPEGMRFQECWDKLNTK